ncbi:tetratricopeptide repeat protein [Marinibactrum halimedae]|uniref:Tetratricopeptide repeat protein n=1 Tax=Marinibactrum halimedae TaxID=1444977 RepID=A0AA37WLW7_9GAMM|nr:hypothetical protein [Marinibactrum halimedae]MCD9457430.1 hypothetical protein [Marinibactrum halimedae]GLS25520.1 hypothetical protein GCM10007877_12340 [Marinibactrum halimedae]
MRVKIISIFFACLFSVTGLADVFYKNVSTPEDLEWGSVLFDYFQKDYFSALVEYDYIVQLDNSIAKSHEGELLKGGMMLSYGIADESEAIFSKLLSGNTLSEEVRNSAWYYLANIFHYKSEDEKAFSALNNIKGNLPIHLLVEYHYLRSLLANYDHEPLSALDHLKTLEEFDPQYSYILFNLAISQLAQEDIPSAIGNLRKVAAYSGSSKELLALADRARHGLAQLYLQQGDILNAWIYLTEIRTQGLYSNRALLTYAWAAIETERFTEAIPALKILNDRDIAIPEVQETKVLLAHLYEQSGEVRKALKHNILAVEAFEIGLSNIEESREIIARQDVPREFVKNFDAIVGVSDWYAVEPTVDYQKFTPFVIDLISSHAFSETLRELSDLYALQDNLLMWQRESSQHLLILENTLKKQYSEKMKESLQEASNIKKSLEEKKSDLKLYSLSLTEKDQARFEAQIENIDSEIRTLEGRIEVLSNVERPYSQPPSYRTTIQDYHNQIELRLVQTNSYIQKLEPIVRRLIESELSKHEERMKYYMAQSRLARARLFDTTLMTLDKAKSEKKTEKSDNEK